MKIANTELVILKVLWRQAPLTVGQIVARVQPENGWHESTIKTLVARLLEKEAITRQKDGRQYFYQPIVSEETVISEASESLLKRFFDGRLAPLISHFAAEKQISDGDLKEIEAILKTLKDHD